jgi:hypothetical protein
VDLQPPGDRARRTNAAGPQGSFRSLSNPGEHRRAFVRRELAYRGRFVDISDPQSLGGPLLIRNDGNAPDHRAVMHADPRANGACARRPSLQVLPIEDEMLDTFPIKDGIGLREVSVERLSGVTEAAGKLQPALAAIGTAVGAIARWLGLPWPG